MAETRISTVAARRVYEVSQLYRFRLASIYIGIIGRYHPPLMAKPTRTIEKHPTFYDRDSLADNSINCNLKYKAYTISKEIANISSVKNVFFFLKRSILVFSCQFLSFCRVTRTNGRNAIVLDLTSGQTGLSQGFRLQ